MNILRGNQRATLFPFFLLTAFFVGTPAWSQEPAAVDLGDPNVTVDLSVLEDNGLGPAPVGGSFLPGPGGMRLLVPGSKIPVSRLHLPAPKVKLRRPAAPPSAIRTAKKKAKKRKPQTAMKAPAAAPAASPAAPPAAPKGMALGMPAKPAAPAKPKMEMVKKAPPAAPALKPKKVTAAPPPAPKMAKPAAPAPKQEKKPVEAAKMAPKKLAPPEKTAPPKAVAEIPPVPSQAVAKPAPKPEAKQQAAVPPAAAVKAPAPGRAVQVVFQADQSKLPKAVTAKLKALAKDMKANDELRIQLLAYAGGKSLSSSRARRLSLSRALAVRSYLIENGIRSTRIDVRALGNKTADEPVNRVDVNVINR